MKYILISITFLSAACSQSDIYDNLNNLSKDNCNNIIYALDRQKCMNGEPSYEEYKNYYDQKNK